MTIVCKEMTVTPQMAVTWLDKKPKNYRTLTKKTVELYARAMAQGSWKLTTQGVTFDEDGNLFDGQHRLHAIIRSGVTIRTLVFFGAKRETEVAYDLNRVRRFDDHTRYYNEPYRHGHLAIAKILEYGIDQHYPLLQPYEEITLVEQYKDGIMFATSERKHKTYIMAPVSAPVARAYYYPSYRERALDYLEVMCTGKPTTAVGDEAALLMRTLVFIEREKDRMKLYRKSESALMAFIKQQPYSKLYGTKEELFPLKVVDGRVVAAKRV